MRRRRTTVASRTCASLLLGASGCASMVAPLNDDGGIVDAVTIPSTPLQVNVQVQGMEGAGPLGGMFVRIDGPNGGTMETTSDATGTVRATVPAAMTPFTITFAGAGWTVESIVSVDHDLTGPVFVQHSCSGLPPSRSVQVLVQGRSAPTTHFAINAPSAAAGTWGTSNLVPWYASSASTRVRFMVYEVDASGAVVNSADVTDAEVPPSGTPIVVDLPRPPQVPTVSQNHVSIQFPTTGMLLPQPLTRWSGAWDAEYAYWTVPTFGLTQLGTAECSNANPSDCTLTAINGHLTGAFWQLTLPAHVGDVAGGVNLLFASATPPTDFVVPQIVSVTGQGTTLDDIVVSAVAPEYTSGVLQVSLVDGRRCSGRGWAVDDASTPMLRARTLPQLPSGVTLASLGLPGDGQMALAEVILSLDAPGAPPRWARDVTYAPQSPSLTVVAMDFSVQQTGR